MKFNSECLEKKKKNILSAARDNALNPLES